MRQLDLELDYEKLENKVIHSMRQSGLISYKELIEQIEIEYEYKLPKLVIDYSEIMRRAKLVSLSWAWSEYREFKRQYQQHGLYKLEYSYHPFMKKPVKQCELKMIHVPDYIYFEDK
jgi:hypothetical protein